MKPFLKTIILRHRKENLRKCSLSGLEDNQNYLFYTYPNKSITPPNTYLTLSLDGPELSRKDSNRGIFLIDGTWHYASIMAKKHAMHLDTRSLPKTLKTAYPRRQDDCQDPTRGLASIEALYIANLILGYDCNYLLDNYYFKDEFLEINKTLISNISDQ